MGTILQTKLAGAGAGVQDAAVLSYPKGLGNVVFASQPDLARPQREFRVPLMVEEGGTSVIVPIRVPYRVVDGVVEVVDDEGRGQYDAVRVRRVKVEGEASEEASRALESFWERNVIVEDVARLQYAVDVIAKRVN